jgi:hypothetical protein
VIGELTLHRPFEDNLETSVNLVIREIAEHQESQASSVFKESAVCKERSVSLVWKDLAAHPDNAEKSAWLVFPVAMVLLVCKDLKETLALPAHRRPTISLASC